MRGPVQPQWILAITTVVHLAMAVAIMVLDASGAGFWGTAIPLWIYILACGFAFPAVQVLALAHHGAEAGTAASLLGALNFGLAGAHLAAHRPHGRRQRRAHGVRHGARGGRRDRGALGARAAEDGAPAQRLTSADAACGCRERCRACAAGVALRRSATRAVRAAASVRPRRGARHRGRGSRHRGRGRRARRDHQRSRRPAPAQREARAKRLGRRAPLVAGVAAVVMAALLGFVIMARVDGLPFEFDEEWAEDVFEPRGPVGDVFAFFMNELGGGVVRRLRRADRHRGRAAHLPATVGGAVLHRRRRRERRASCSC